MLLFKPQHIPLILNGTKTQTRRMWKVQRINVGSIQLAKTKMLSKEFFAKLKIISIWVEPLGKISNEDAIKEGYSSRETYFKAFGEINRIPDIQAYLTTPVYCVEFVVFKEEVK